MKKILDISEIKNNNDIYKVLVEKTLNYIYLIDSKYRILSANTSAKKVFRKRFKNIIGKKVNQIFPPQISKGYITSLKKVFKTGRPLVSKNSKMVVGNNLSYLTVTLSPVKDSEGKVISVIGVSHDITSEVIAEKKMKESEEKYRRLFETAKDSILILNAVSGEITDSNPYLQELLGYSAKELVGKKIFEIGLFKDIVKNKEKFIELQKKKYVRYDNLSLQTKKGEKKYVEFISNVYKVGDKKVIQCNIRDITEKKEVEKAKENFLSLASHQLRTPLSITKWVLETLTHEEHLTPHQKEKFNELIYTNERLIKLINNILSVSVIDNGRLEVNKKMVNIRQLIFELAESLKKFAINKEKIIKITCPKKLKEIYCDPLLISEALTNLLINAINYSSHESEEIKLIVTERTNDYQVSIHNSGVMDLSLQEKINKYERFVRGVNAIDKQTAGSGLGLYITKKVMEANGGKIWFESNVKSGTTFYVAINKK